MHHKITLSSYKSEVVKGIKTGANCYKRALHNTELGLIKFYPTHAANYCIKVK